MKPYKRLREVVEDDLGKRIPLATVTVYSETTGNLAVLYGDSEGTGGSIGSQVQSSTVGEVSFYAEDGRYRLEVAKTGFTTIIIRDVNVGGGGGDPSIATISILRHLVAGQDQNVAVQTAIEEAMEQKATGIARPVIDCAGYVLRSETPFSLTAGLADSTFQRAFFQPLPGNWFEDDNAWLTFLAGYQTVTSEGKLWSHRKPILRIEEGNPGLILRDVFGTGTPDGSTTRLSAGIRALGKYADRYMIGGKWVDCETYGFAGASALADHFQMELIDVEFKVNGRSSRQERTSYGVILGGNDMFHRGLKIYYAHCPLLVTEFGATMNFYGYDMFNGAQFSMIEGSTTYQHRLVEYYGNTNVFGAGSRNGQGKWHVHNTDIVIAPNKWDNYANSSPTQTAAICLYSKQADDALRNFCLDTVTADVPISLKTNVPWLEFVEPAGTNWKGALKTQLNDLKGYVRVFGGPKVMTAQGDDSSNLGTEKTWVAGAFHYLEDETTTTGVGYGVTGNTFLIVAGDDPKWEFVNSGVLRPSAGKLGQLGSASQPVNEAFISLLSGESRFTLKQGSSELTANKQFSFRFKSNTEVELQVRGDDGVTRKLTLGGFVP